MRPCRRTVGTLTSLVTALRLRRVASAEPPRPTGPDKRPASALGRLRRRQRRATHRRTRRNARAHRKPRDQGRSRSSMTCGAAWVMYMWAPFAGNGAPLIDEPAATRERVAMEGGDELAGPKSRRPFALRTREPDRTAEPSAATRPSEARGVGRAAPPEGIGRANAPRRAGASQRKVAMSTPV